MENESPNPRKTEDLLSFISQPEPEPKRLGMGLYQQLQNAARYDKENFSLEIMRKALDEMFNQRQSNEDRGQDS